MAPRFAVGDAVHTPLGKGVVREVRNNGRVLVDVAGRALVIPEADISIPDRGKRKHAPATPKSSEPSGSPPGSGPRPGAGYLEVDLHGLAVEEALSRVEQALNEALLADCSELRLIHGRSGGRIRAALHRFLRQIPSVRSFRLDPRNEGVTIVAL